MPERVIKKFNEFNPATGKWEVVKRPLDRVARAGRPPQPKPAAAPVVDMSSGPKTLDVSGSPRPVSDK